MKFVKIKWNCKGFFIKCANLFEVVQDKWLRELVYVFNLSVHTPTGYTPDKLFFGQKVRKPTDILFSAASGNKNEIFPISEFKRKLSDMCELANESMNNLARQMKAQTYLPGYKQDTNFIYQDTNKINCR